MMAVKAWKRQSMMAAKAWKRQSMTAVVVVSHLKNLRLAHPLPQIESPISRVLYAPATVYWKCVGCSVSVCVLVLLV